MSATVESTSARPAITTAVEDGIAIVTFDIPGEAVNTLREDFVGALTATMDRLQDDEAVRAIVLISGKKDVFIAGADIQQFLTLRTAADAERLSREGQAALGRLATGKPVLAAIHGACLGGGLELTLACHYRIASEHPKTVFALPEVQLGIIPGAGGTQRLPKTVGLASALDMILTGRNVRARKAWQMGLVDELVHPSILRALAVRRARELAAGTARHEKKRGGAKAVLLEDNPIGRGVVFRQAREGVLKKTRGHYPAPLAAIEAVRAGYERGMTGGLAEEARWFGQLAVSEVSKQLVFLFFATTALKKDAGVPEPVPEPSPVSKVAILGAGFMGAGIASVVVQQGLPVRLKDAKHEAIGRGLGAVRAVIEERLKKRQLTRVQFDDTMSLVSGTLDYTGFRAADVVIEAVFEDVAVKHQVLREVEKVASERAIFASNTSTIPIARIAEASARPDRVIGMHFFSPVHRMPLLEVIVTEQTDPQVTVTVAAFGRRIGKTVIVVNDAPGFYANRILSPYLNEAGRLLDEGASIEAVDRALTSFGFPVGPITLLDEVGLDVAGKVGVIIAEAFGERMAPSRTLRAVVEAGRLGRKAKSGFYRYDAQGKKEGVDGSVYDLFPTGRTRSEFSSDEVVRRTVLAMVNEAARTLEEGIVRSPRDGDVGAVFGIGFPPFRGGPFRYVDTLGAAEIVRQLEALHARFGPRFEPAAVLVRMARSGERFYPASGKPV